MVDSEVAPKDYAGATLLLDSDIIAFRIAAVMETKTAFGKVVEPLEAAIRATDKYISDLKRKLKANDVIACLSCREHNWRDDVLPSYKQQRDHSERPEHLTALKEHMTENYESYLRYGLEADDVMGILATHPTLVKGRKIIVSEDKDMRTVPALLYAPHRAELGVVRVTELQARQFHMWQAICGDTVDGYKGAPRVGAASLYAQSVLEEDMVDLWGTVLSAYGSVGLGEEEALQQARVAQILTAGWYDFKEKEVITFEPHQISHF